MFRRMSNSHLSVRTLALASGMVALAASCGLVKVNGKPLGTPGGGGGATAPASSGGAASSGGSAAAVSPDELPPTPSGRFTDEYGNTTPDWAPAWCGNYRGATGTGSWSVDDETEDEGYWADRPLRSLAQAQCEFRKGAEDTAKIRAVAAKYKAEFAAAWGLSEAEFEPILALSLAQTYNNEAQGKACEQIAEPDEDAEAKVRDHQAAIGALACRSEANDDYDWFDASATSVVAAMRDCALAAAGIADSKSELKSPWNMARFAECNTLAARLDKPAFLAEIAEAKLPPYARLMAIGQYQRTIDALARARTAYGELAKKSSEYQAVLFDVPAKGLADFTALYKAQRDVMDPIARLMKNPKSKAALAAFKDCGKTYYDVVTRRFAEAKPATVDAAVAVFDDVGLGFATAGLAMCEKLHERPGLAGMFGSRVGALPEGPRAAARWAAMQYLSEHADDFGDFSISGGMARSSLDVGGRGGAPDSGVVAKVSAPDADGLVSVTFKTESWMEPVWKCRQTSKIDRLEWDGDKVKVIYRENCVEAGKKKVSRTPAPVKVDARFVGGLAAGRFAEVDYWRDGTGAPIQVWDSKDRKKLLGYFGLTW
jgi:hypothetical protein